MAGTRVAVVTGTSEGLGLAIATEFVAAGWKVYGAARRSGPRLGPNYIHGCVDLIDPVQVQSWMVELDRQVSWSSLQQTVLVNNAGTLGPMGPSWLVDPSALRATYRLNVDAAVQLMQAMFTRWHSGRLDVVNISSGAAQKAYSGWHAYCATKAALRMASKVFAEDVLQFVPARADQFAVLSYAPGVVDTEMQALIRQQADAQFPQAEYFRELQRSGRLVAPAGPARDILQWLALRDNHGFVEKRYAGS